MSSIVSCCSKIVVIGNLYLLLWHVLDVESEVGNGVAVIVHILICVGNLLVKSYLFRIKCQCFLQLSNSTFVLFVFDQQTTKIEIVLCDIIFFRETCIEEGFSFTQCCIIVFQIGVVVEKQTLQNHVIRIFLQSHVYDLFRLLIILFEEKNRCVACIVA